MTKFPPTVVRQNKCFQKLNFSNSRKRILIFCKLNLNHFDKNLFNFTKKIIKIPFAALILLLLTSAGLLLSLKAAPFGFARTAPAFGAIAYLKVDKTQI